MSVGSTIAGRFEILSQAGSGGMSSVFRAHDRSDGRMVAVKVLQLDGPFDLARFGREATMLGAVHHPNVVDYVAHGVEDGVHYLVQEWVDGITLGTHLTTVGATAQEAIDVAIGVASALAATHAIGIVHRDVKPGNILLSRGDARAIKLVDFGIARRASESGVLTRSGVLVGTPAYMSPEQARGSIQIDSATDVWSLGCVMFEALTGRSPFVGPTPLATRAKVLIGDPPPLEPLCAEAPDELVALIDAMLRKPPSERPADGAALLARLHALPAIPDGPRRVFGAPPPSTDALMKRRAAEGSAPRMPPSSFVMFSALAPLADDSLKREAELERIAERHQMDLHVFEDGSALMSSTQAGRPGAIGAARAAIDLSEELANGAISVFGHDAADKTIADAIDRGATLAERAAMGAMFGEVVDDTGASASVIHVDEHIAELIVDEIPIEQGEAGPVLRAGRNRTENR